MRFRNLLPVGAACAVLPLIYFLYPRYNDHDNIGEFVGWKPTPPEIAKAVGKGGGPFDDARHKQFSKIFQQRFRDHEIAVGVHFVDDKTLKLMCGAVVPRWDMSRVAVQLHNEAYALFGVDYKVNIYETYISRRMKKLGELRQTGQDGHTIVDFDEKYEIADQLAHPVKRAPSRLFMRSPGPLGSPVPLGSANQGGPVPPIKKRMIPMPPPEKLMAMPSQ
jgi:hypothetical protein